MSKGEFGGNIVMTNCSQSAWASWRGLCLRCFPSFSLFINPLSHGESAVDKVALWQQYSI